jgi:hypothetical protein
MILEALALIIGFYLFACVGTYTYAVVKSHEILGFWTFKIHNGILGVCKLPKFMSWMERITTRG